MRYYPTHQEVQLVQLALSWGIVAIVWTVAVGAWICIVAIVCSAFQKGK